MASNLIVLGWHNARPTWCFPSLRGATEQGLENQLRKLGRIANVVPLETALCDLAAGRPLPPRAVALTFDDGYRDNLEVAAPMLRRLGLPATAFLVPGLLDGAVNPWWERLAWMFAKATEPSVEWEGRVRKLGSHAARHEAFKAVGEHLKSVDRVRRDLAVNNLEERLGLASTYDPCALFLDWDEARRLGDYMTLGSHSMYHAILSKETPDAQRDDLVESRRRLETELGVNVNLLAYPNGTADDYDDHTRAAAAQAGYSFSVTTRGGITTQSTPPHDIRRWVMNPNRGWLDFARIVRDLTGRRT